MSFTSLASVSLCSLIMALPSIHVRQLCEEYGVDHMRSSPYYLQMNSQVEATNKTLLRILNRMVYDEPKQWTCFLSLVLWANCILKCTSTRTTPFSLVYKTEAMVPIRVMTPSARFALVSKLLDSHEIYLNV